MSMAMSLKTHSILNFYSNAIEILKIEKEITEKLFFKEIKGIEVLEKLN